MAAQDSSLQKILLKVDYSKSNQEHVDDLALLGFKDKHLIQNAPRFILTKEIIDREVSAFYHQNRFSFHDISKIEKEKSLSSVDFPTFCTFVKMKKDNIKSLLYLTWESFGGSFVSATLTPGVDKSKTLTVVIRNAHMNASFLLENLK